MSLFLILQHLMRNNLANGSGLILIALHRHNKLNIHQIKEMTGLCERSIYANLHTLSKQELVRLNYETKPLTYQITDKGLKAINLQ